MSSEALRSGGAEFCVRVGREVTVTECGCVCVPTVVCALGSRQNGDGRAAEGGVSSVFRVFQSCPALYNASCVALECTCVGGSHKPSTSERRSQAWHLLPQHGPPEREDGPAFPWVVFLVFPTFIRPLSVASFLWLSTCVIFCSHPPTPAHSPFFWGGGERRKEVFRPFSVFSNHVQRCTMQVVWRWSAPV